MAGTRTTFSPSPTGRGDLTQFRVNTFALSQLKEMVSGKQLAGVLKRAIRPAFDRAYVEWPVLTGASRDTIRVLTSEIGETNARVALVVGGPPLIKDPRNKSGKDYAPFVEFNGTSKTPAGTLTNAMIESQGEIKDLIADGIRQLVRGITRG